MLWYSFGASPRRSYLVVFIMSASVKVICCGTHYVRLTKIRCCGTHYVRLREEHMLWYSFGASPRRTYLALLIWCASANNIRCGTHKVRLHEEHMLWYSLGAPPRRTYVVVLIRCAPRRTYVVVLIRCASAKNICCGTH